MNRGILYLLAGLIIGAIISPLIVNYYWNMGKNITQPVNTSTPTLSTTTSLITSTTTRNNQVSKIKPEIFPSFNKKGIIIRGSMVSLENQWYLIIKVVNNGTMVLNISDILLNGKPAEWYSGVKVSDLPLRVLIGGQGTISITIYRNSIFKPGPLNVTLVSNIENCTLYYLLPTEYEGLKYEVIKVDTYYDHYNLYIRLYNDLPFPIKIVSIYLDREKTMEPSLYNIKTNLTLPHTFKPNESMIVEFSVPKKYTLFIIYLFTNHNTPIEIKYSLQT